MEDRVPGHLSCRPNFWWPCLVLGLSSLPFCTVSCLHGLGSSCLFTLLPPHRILCYPLPPFVRPLPPSPPVLCVLTCAAIWLN
uniref:Uncharacterized protein n=1 Tax=Mus musculus TaxID=10090 RepID=Q3U4R6_MOUSE|nr:unnamed protein product [Mus musculus]